MKAQKKSNKAKIIIIIILVLVVAFFALGHFRRRAPMFAAPGTTPPGEKPRDIRHVSGKMPSREEQEKMRAELITDLKLTSDQIAKLKTISEKYGPVGDVKNLGAILREMGKEMTPEQQQASRAFMRKQMMMEMKRQDPTLTPAQMEKAFKEFESQKPPEGFSGPEKPSSEQK